MATEPRELFPLKFLGEKEHFQSVGGTRNPDGSEAGRILADVPEPTEADLIALENGAEPPLPFETPELPVDPEPDLADAVGKGRGAKAKD